jgi:hypothetical protein
MKIKGKITMLIGSEKTTIEIRDSDAACEIIHIELDPQQLADILSRRAHVDCEIGVFNLERIGKTHECKRFEFEISKEAWDLRFRNKLITNTCCLLALEESGNLGWVPDTYYGSKNSFFTKDEKYYAATTIRRWV